MSSVLEKNFAKKIEKLNKFMKTSDSEVYYWMFSSKASKFDYKYLSIREDITNLIKKEFKEDSEIFFLVCKM